MTLKIYNDRLVFDNYEIKVDDSGLLISGLFEITNIGIFKNVSNGYTMGGAIEAAATPYVDKTYNTIDKISFSSDANATNVGDLGVLCIDGSGYNSSENGYNSGFRVVTPTPGLSYNIFTGGIKRFPFASAASGAASVVTPTEYLITGYFKQPQGISSSTHGYQFHFAPPVTYYFIKFPFAVEENVTKGIGELINTFTPSSFASYGATQVSATHGYHSFGPPLITTIYRFAFTSDSQSALSIHTGFPVSSVSGVGHSSETHGYHSGGYSGTNVMSNNILKFPFAVYQASIASIGNLTQSRYGSAGMSSLTHGYTGGGASFTPTTPPFTYTTHNIIDKFPFATDANATDVGDLSQSKAYTNGVQG